MNALFESVNASMLDEHVDVVASNAGVINENTLATRFSKAASHYDAQAKIQRSIANAALSNLPMKLQGKWLDIGCGTGMHTQALFQRGAEITGVDIAAGMINTAQKRYPNISFIEGSAQALPVENSQVDSLFSSMALQWCADTQCVADECARVLRIGGEAEFSIMVAGSFQELHSSRLLAQLPEAVTPLPTTASWLASFHSAGFKVSRLITKDYVDTHADVMSLLRSIKGVGAGETGKRHASLSRRDIKKLGIAYDNRFGVEGKLPLTYRVSHFRLEKS